MELILPFMLIVLQWHPDHAGEFTIDRPPVLFETRADREKGAAEFVERHTMYAEELGNVKYVTQCMQLPHPEELNELYERRFGEERGKRAPDQEEQNVE